MDILTYSLSIVNMKLYEKIVLFLLFIMVKLTMPLAKAQPQTENPSVALILFGFEL